MLQAMKIKITSWLKQRVAAICTKLERKILSNKLLKCKVVYGPVRSRRLGLVLGINNVKSKTCSYNCIYCPSGKTSCCSVSTNSCLSPYELYISVNNKLEEIRKSGKQIDYILFAGSGAPSLDVNLSKEISLLREFGYKIAVFTNSSLLWNDNIQENLMFADYVSLKIDTVNEETWLKINRPHQRLRYDLILDSIKQFSKRYRGTLITETTLIKNVNDSAEEIEQLSEYLNGINRSASYFMTPMFPTSESYAVAPDAETLIDLSALIKEKIEDSVVLCSPEIEEFYVTDDFENEFMGLLALHPVNKEAVKTFVKDNGNLKKLNELITNHSINEVIHNGKIFFAMVEQPEA